MIFLNFFFLAFSIKASPSNTLLIGSDIAVSCIVNITIEVTAHQVVWADQYFNLLNAVHGNLTGDGIDLMDDLILSLDLMINEVQVSNAGVYICEAMINDTLGDVATIQKQYTLTVESKSLFFTFDYYCCDWRIPINITVYINTHNITLYIYMCSSGTFFSIHPSFILLSTLHISNSSLLCIISFILFS